MHLKPMLRLAPAGMQIEPTPWVASDIGSTPVARIAPVPAEEAQRVYAVPHAGVWCRAHGQFGRARPALGHPRGNAVASWPAYRTSSSPSSFQFRSLQ